MRHGDVGGGFEAAGAGAGGPRGSIQPLAVETTVRRQSAAVHAGAWAGGTSDKVGTKAEKSATDAVAVLRERAGRLLRK